MYIGVFLCCIRIIFLLHTIFSVFSKQYDELLDFKISKSDCSLAPGNIKKKTI